ncbi:discoidin domain-containing protein [Paenibacillus nasutitermitis]|uniref:F5/8 type C domain-containing protein n=1 Tax=Paenibacillus nasutitermitis TaxID=1652958 RepID=A0A916Z3X4_9BACL|nr:discoidin domain-containing protein [Paenibacillus nasutitermitis]GGD72523.1 hypothetical protein GCM10010911_33010 [Paenibacillus nasutitermitis]
MLKNKQANRRHLVWTAVVFLLGILFAGPGSLVNPVTVLAAEQGWEFTGDTQGWGSAGNISGFGWQAGGYLGGTISGSDSQFYSADNLGLDASKNSLIRIKMKNSTSATLARIFFTTSDNTSWGSNNKAITLVANDTGYREYTIDLSDVSGWKGWIKQFRIDPVDDGTTNTGSFRIDYIRTGDGWDFTKDAESWGNAGNITGFGWQTGGYLGGTISGTDSQFYSPDHLGLSAGSKPVLKIRMKNSSSSNLARVFFTTAANPNWGSNNLSFTTIPNDTGYTEYTIDFSSFAGWTGTIKQLRIDPVDNGTTSAGTFSIDYVKLVAKNRVSWGSLAATDDLGRKLSQIGDTGIVQPRENRVVGMFYEPWHGGEQIHQYNNVYNNQKLLNDNPNIFQPNASGEYNNPLMPRPNGDFIHWNKPLFGYYSSNDQWVIRKHLQMLALAGVDFLEIDVTNNQNFQPQIDLLMRTIEDLQRSGVQAPKIVMLTHTNSVSMMDKLYQTFYAPDAPYYHPTTWFYWKGKPLIVGDQNASATVKDFFTLRIIQWPGEYYTNGFEIGADYALPQHISYNDLGEKENISVNTSQSFGKNNIFSLSIPYIYNEKPYSKSRAYHNGADDLTSGSQNYGYFAQEQWDYAISQDPLMINVIAWNDWITGNWQKTTQTDKYILYDDFDDRYSKDLEPMEGGFGDNYYMQLANNIRRFKGAEAPAEPSAVKTITINTDFSQWTDVNPSFKDFTGDTMARNYPGVDNQVYKDTTGRNDFDITKIARDASNIYFYAKTVNPITPYTDSNWMTLYLNVDGNGTNGWKGYDYVINRTPAASTTSTLEKSTGGWNWTAVATNISYSVSGNQIMLKIPRSSLGNIADPVNIEFKWVDNWQNNDNIMDFYKYGDAAPDARFNYLYSTAAYTGRVDQTTEVVTLPAPAPVPSGYYKIEDNAPVWDYFNTFPYENWWTESDTGSSGGTVATTTNYFTDQSEFKFGTSTRTVGFHGNGVRWITTKSPDATRAEIFIDGLSQGIVDLSSVTVQKQIVAFEKYGLSDGFHEMRIQWQFESGSLYNDAMEYRVGSAAIPSPVPGENLALKSSAYADTFDVAKFYPLNPGQVNDKDNSSYWQGTGTGSIWLDFGRPVTIDRIETLQNTTSSRIGSYTLSYWNESTGAWSTAKTGTSMADEQIDTFTAVSTHLIKLTVNSMQTGTKPAIYEIKAFNTANPGTPASAAKSGWDFTNDAEGWGNAVHTTGFGWQRGGYIGAAVSASGPQFFSPDNLNLSAGSYKTLRIKMKNATTSAKARLYFITDTDTTWGGTKVKEFSIIPSDGVFSEYTIDLSSVSSWTGTIKQIRIDPVSAGSSGTFSVDYIRLQTVPLVLKKWNFSTNVEDWTASSGISNFGWQTGGMMGGDITINNGGYLLSPSNLNIDISRSPTFKVRLKNSTASTSALVIFRQAADAEWYYGQAMYFAIKPNDTGFTDYYFKAPAYNGLLSQLMIFPARDAGSGSFSMDNISIGYSQNISELATASASSSLDTSHGPEKALDHRNTSYWSASTGSFPQTLTYDFGSSRQVSSVRSGFYLKDAWKSKIEASNDGTNWTTLLDVNNLKHKFTSSTEGWTGSNMSGFGWKSGGYIGGTITSADPQIYSPDNLNVSLNGVSDKHIVIRMKNGTSDTLGTLYYTTTADPTFNGAKSIPIYLVANDTGYTDYELDLDYAPNASGTLKQLRIDPVESATSGTFSIDSVKMVSSELSVDVSGSYRYIRETVLDSDVNKAMIYNMEVNGTSWSSEGEASNTIANDTDPGITYSGSWSSSAYDGYYNSDYHASNTANDYAQYTFTGTSISWVGPRGINEGKADVYIDGVLDTSAIDLYASSGQLQQVLYTKTGLSPGSHTIKVVVRSDKNPSSSGYYVLVDAFQYQ